jgi:hypothetical protein
MLQLQEADNWEKPAATTWAAEFLLRDGESREFLGSWINSSAVHEAKKRRAKQVITCSFPCGKWLHMIGARASPGCELCKRERNMDLKTTDVLPTETVAHIQSAGCKAQKKSVIGAHNRCWKYLIGAISTHGEATRDLEFIGGDKDKQLEKLWAETKIGDILPWDEIADEAERLLESDQATRRVPDDDQADKEQEDDQEVDRDETDTLQRNYIRTEKTGLYCSRVEQQSFVRPRVQAHIGSKAKLPGARGSPCTGSTRRPRQKPRKGGRRSSWRE